MVVDRAATVGELLHNTVKEQDRRKSDRQLDRQEQHTCPRERGRSRADGELLVFTCLRIRLLKLCDLPLCKQLGLLWASQSDN